MSADPAAGSVIHPRLQIVAWEITRACNLYCAHCRASAVDESQSGELSTEECFRLVDRIRAVGKPIIILTGGEPLLRKDVFSIAEYVAASGLRVVMGTNGTLVGRETATRLKDIPLSRISVSLDFPIAELQDKFRGQAGAYAAAMTGIDNIRTAGIDLQINCTLTRLNIAYLDDLLRLAQKAGAVAFHPFFLVPTGRGKELESVQLTSEEYETALNWIYTKQLELGDRIFFKPTDAPHYMRLLKQKQKQNAASGVSAAATTAHRGPANSISRGCLAGTGFCFISHLGLAKGCGYLDIEAGNVRNQDFSEIWEHSPLFTKLRNLANLKGKCGECEYKVECGGCRARAYETTGDYLEAEPYCLHQPQKRGAV